MSEKNVGRPFSRVRGPRSGEDGVPVSESGTRRPDPSLPLDVRTIRVPVGSDRGGASSRTLNLAGRRFPKSPREAVSGREIRHVSLIAAIRRVGVRPCVANREPTCTRIRPSVTQPRTLFWRIFPPLCAPVCVRCARAIKRVRTSVYEEPTVRQSPAAQFSDYCRCGFQTCGYQRARRLVPRARARKTQSGAAGRSFSLFSAASSNCIIRRWREERDV